MVACLERSTPGGKTCHSMGSLPQEVRPVTVRAVYPRREDLSQDGQRHPSARQLSTAMFPFSNVWSPASPITRAPIHMTDRNPQLCKPKLTPAGVLFGEKKNEQQYVGRKKQELKDTFHLDLLSYSQVLFLLNVSWGTAFYYQIYLVVNIFILKEYFKPNI